jgi:predicted ATPase
MNKIEKIGLNNITKFKKASIDCASGINVFIGENGTGKTHLLKAVYAFLKTTEKYDDFGSDLAKKLDNTFNTGGIENLISKNQEEEASLSMLINNQNYSYSIFQNGNFPTAIDEGVYKNISFTKNCTELNSIKALFIPTHEIVTTYVELRDWLDRYKNNFEETYLDLAKALFHTPTKEVGSLHNALDFINEIINGKVVFSNNEFLVEYDQMKIKATMLAEGVKKFILFAHLIKNQSLTSDTILFIDEPEVHFNPKYITLFNELLVLLANSGVQVFVATHDYLFIHQLTLMQEYKATISKRQDKDIPTIMFHSLYSNAKKQTEIESSEKLSEINHNPILDEFTGLYNREQQLFNLSM